MLPTRPISRARLARAVLTLAPLGCACALPAQSEADIFNLDPFVVSTDAIGYQARNSLSGTKFEIQVREVPITITALTLEFLEDTYSLTLEDAIQFSAGITTGAKQSAEETGSFYIRGLRTLRSKRNGIIQLYSQDMTNVQRVEVVKGPMSLLYGQTEPGGIINYLTLKALPEFRTDLRLTVGNYAHYRAQINHTGPILKGDPDDQSGRLLYRLDASHKRDDGYRENMEDERSFVSTLLEYRPFARTTVELQWDYLNQNSFNLGPLPKLNQRWRAIWEELVATTPPAQLPLLRLLGAQDPYSSYAYAPGPFGLLMADTSEPRLWDGYAEHWDWKINPTPRNSYNDVDQHTYSLEIRQRLFDQWFAKLYIVHHDINRRSAWGSIWGVGISGDTSPGYSWNHFDRYNSDTAYQLEITGKWKLGPAENQSLIGFEYLDNNFENYLAQGGFSNVVNPDVYDWIRSDPNNPYFGQSIIFSNVRDLTIDLAAPQSLRVDEKKNTEAAFISNVARFRNDRLLLLSGLRFDSIQIKRYGRDNEGRRVLSSDFKDHSVSPQIGMSYRLSDSVTLYGSYSESFVPQSGSIAVLKKGDELAAQLPLPPAERQLTNPVAREPLLGTGYELGAKFDLLDARISGSFSFFHIELTGVDKSFFVEVPGFFDDRQPPQPQSVLVASQNNGREIDGFETEIFIRPADGWQLVFTYAYLDSVELLAREVGDIREGAAVPLSIPSVSVPKHQAGLWSKYTFRDGRLEGLSLGFGFSWLDQRYGAYSLRSGNPAASGFVGSDEAVEDRILLDDVITYDFLAAYKFQVRGADCSLQLNLKNLLNTRFIEPGGMPNEPFRSYLSLQVRF